MVKSSVKRAPRYENVNREESISLCDSLREAIAGELVIPPAMILNASFFENLKTFTARK